MSDTALKCPICQMRKPKRFCPARNENICAICCGQEREVSIRCPFECEFLREARKHEELLELDAKAVPHPDVELTERFLHEHEMLGQLMGIALWAAVRKEPDAVDSDVREALAALTQTYRTLESGLVFETRPANPYAARIAASVREDMQMVQAELQRETGMAQLRDREIFGMLVFFERLALQINNERRLGRAFIDLLWQNHGGMDQAEDSPEEPPSLLIG